MITSLNLVILSNSILYLTKNSTIMLNKSLMTLFVCILAMHSLVVFSKDVVKPELMLANSYHQGLDLNDYWVSEKYDGVRALWDGKQFISRGGNIYHAPEWFTKGFPKQRLDGELWISRNTFELLVSTVRDKVPSNEAWKKVSFMVFDMPDVEATFDYRLTHLNQFIQKIQIPWLIAVKQTKVKSHKDLMKSLEKITAFGAEGLMLHKGSSMYRGKRTGDLLKVKLFQDAEAVVIEHIEGKGKYKNKLGALLVSLENGVTFKVGTGFSDKERSDPPKIGSVITYRYRGKTKNGIPRFASFLRERVDKN